MTTLTDLLSCQSALLDVLSSRRRRAFIPPPRLTADKWADEFRIVPTESSSISGGWQTSQYEIARGPLLAISDPRVRKISIMSSAQLMKTTALEICIGFHMHLDPCPMLFYSSSQDTIDTTVMQKLDPMIYNTPELAALWGGKANLERKNEKFTRGRKVFQGGFLELMTINSTANLRNRAAKVVMIDEVDDCQQVADGDPVELATDRTNSFKGEEKIILSSTPTILGKSKIDASYRESDMRKPYVRCRCGHEEYLKWSQVDFRDENGKVNPEIAKYVGECGHIWTEAERIRALTTEGAVMWRQTRPFECCGELQHPEQERLWSDDGLAVCKHCGDTPIPVEHSGYWGWIAYSPRWSMKDIAKAFLDSKGDPGKLRAFVNTKLAETWVEASSEELVVDPTIFASRVEPAWDKVPSAVKAVTIGVDVQPAGKKGGLHVEAVGWGDGEENWSLEHIHIVGDPDSGEVWAELDELRLRRWETEDGRYLMAQAVCIDTGGHNTDSVMAYCGQRKAQRVWAIKGGNETPGKRAPIWPTTPPQTIRHGAKLHIVGTQAGKDWVASCISKTQPGPGYMHVPSDRASVWFEQMTNEKRRTVMVNGRPATQWRPRYDGVDVEALDCRVYAKAALEGLKRLGVRLGVASAAATATPAQSASQDQKSEGSQVKQLHQPVRRKKLIQKRSVASSVW